MFPVERLQTLGLEILDGPSRHLHLVLLTSMVPPIVAHTRAPSLPPNHYVPMYGVCGAKVGLGSRLPGPRSGLTGEQQANMLRFCTWFFERAQLR